MKTGVASRGAGGALSLGTKPSPAAPGLGKGREVLIFVVGLFSLYLLWVAVRPCAFRLCRFIGRKVGIQGAPGANKFRRYRRARN